MAAGVVFLIGFVGLLWYEFTKYRIMAGKDYIRYYLIDFSSQTTLIERTLATIEPYALCAFLALFPSKRLSTAALLMHIFSAIPMLLIGARFDFVLNVLFMIIYYLLREHTDGKGTWIGRLEKTVLAAGIPVGLVGLELLQFIRGREVSAQLSIFDLIIESINAQGVTYYVLGLGHDVQGNIAQIGFKGYSFAKFSDYFVHGPLGSFFFGTTNIPVGNSITQAVEGIEYSQTLSYFTHYNYLGGGGYGSSYLLELNQDFGKIGVAVFSFFFGVLLSFLPQMFKRNWIVGAISLIICNALFFMPRGGTIDWLTFIWTPQFWFCILLIAGGAAVLRMKRFQGFTEREGIWSWGKLLRQKTGGLYEHGQTQGSAWSNKTKNSTYSAYLSPIRWIGAGNQPTFEPSDRSRILYR
jgi:oligosaccharide repeat unit polymerase